MYKKYFAEKLFTFTHFNFGYLHNKKFILKSTFTFYILVTYMLTYTVNNTEYSCLVHILHLVIDKVFKNSLIYIIKCYIL